MIHLNITIKNPWSDRWDIVKSKHRLLFGNWAWQSAIYQTGVIFSFEFDLKFRTNHQGVNLFVALFGRAIEFGFYDRRHWPRR